MLREREVGGSSQEAAANYPATRNQPYAPMQEAADQPVISDTTQETTSEDDLQFDPWTERARAVRLQWTGTEQEALARALRHAPNDGAAVVMAQVTLGAATRC